MPNFKYRELKVPDMDCDITLKFPSGESLVLEQRISNAEPGYRGSLNIILPKNQTVECFKGHKDKKAPKAKPEDCQFGPGGHARTAQQLLIEIP